MRALYPKRYALPSALLLLFALSGCEAEPPAAKPNTAQEPWPNKHEAVFQEAEALKYSLQQNDLEQQKLQDAGLEGTAPLIRR